MKAKIFATGALIALSSLLSACGGTATPTTAPVAATVAPTAMVAATEAPTAMMAASPSAMMGGTPSAMMGETPGAVMTSTTMSGGTGGTGAKRAVVISSKGFTEEFILGEMYALVLADAGVPVERKLNLGTETIVHEALLKGGGQGGVDLYPEYTSTGLQVILKADPIADPQQAYDAVKKGYKALNLVWLDKTPMNDTQAMATTKEVSDKMGIKSLQDLCDKAPSLTVAAVAEFKDRPDALPALQKIYGGCKFKEIKVMDAGLRYQALLNKDVDISQAFGTDGQIAGNGLVLLADPKNWGPPDNVAPVIRQEVLDMYPQIPDVLNKLSAKITNQEISALNWEVDGNHKEFADVAKAWLQKQGLIK